jgi:cell division protein FtsW
MNKSAVASRSGQSASGSTPAQILIPRIALIAIVGALLLFGLVMLYSSSSVYSYYYNDGDSASLFVKQLGFVVVGVVICIIAAVIPYQTIIEKFGGVIWVATTCLLAATLVAGFAAFGAQRQIEIGPMSLQPSELGKIAIIILLVQMVDQLYQKGSSRSSVVAIVLVIAVPVGLIALEPDLGTTIIAVVGVLAVFWFGGISTRHILMIIAVLGILALIMILGAEFRQDRLDAFFDPWGNADGSGYQILNSYYAFGDGGLFGVGVGMSRQKFSYLPEAHNDFIFAIVGEELGLVGALAVVLLFMGFLYTAFCIARNAPDRRGSMLAGSAAVLIGFQAFLNMLCVVGALPVTGKALPFFSVGGSSLITTMILVGLILSVSMQSKQLSVHERRREELLIINGGGKAGNTTATARPAAQTRNVVEKVVPISRARAARDMARKQGSQPPAYRTESSAPRTAAKAQFAASATSATHATPSTQRRANGRAARPKQPALSLQALCRNRTGLSNRVPQVSGQTAPSQRRVYRKDGAA